MSWLARRTLVQRRILFSTVTAVVLLLVLHNPTQGFDTWCAQTYRSWIDARAGEPAVSPRDPFYIPAPTCEASDDWASLTHWRSEGALVPFVSTVGQLLSWLLGALVIAAAAWVLLAEQQKRDSLS